MKLTWHFIRKDLRRHRWALLFWALLIVAQVGFGVVLLRVDHANLELAAWFQRGNWLLVFLQFTTGYFLVTQFVQDDELTGTRMFWLTRPVSARRLLAAKAIGILLVFAVLPVVLLLPWWLYCGFGARELGWVALETLSWQLLMIAPAVLIASLTDDLGRAIMWTLLLIAGLAAWTGWVQTSLKMALGGPSPSDNSGLMFSRLWLAGLILLFGTAMIAAHQFLTRRFVRSLGLTVPVLGLIVLTGRFWPWDYSTLFRDLDRRESPSPVAAESFAGVQVTLGQAQIRYRDRDTVAPKNQDRLELRTSILQTLEVRGMPGELMVSGRSTVQHWRWPDDPVGAHQETRFEYWSELAVRKVFALPKAEDDPETVRWWQERQAKANAKLVAQGMTPIPLWPRPGDVPTMLGFVRLPDPLVARIQARPPASDLIIQAEVSRPQVVLELPLAPGAHASGDSQTFRITSLFRPHQIQDHVTLGLVLTSPGQRGSGVWGVNAIEPGHRDGLPRMVMGVDRAAGDCWSASLRYDEGGEPIKAQVGGVKIRWAVCGVSSPQVIRDGEWVPRYPGWFDQTSLVLLDSRPVARFTREVRTEKFEFTPAEVDRSRPKQSF